MAMLLVSVAFIPFVSAESNKTEYISMDECFQEINVATSQEKNIEISDAIKKYDSVTIDAKTFKKNADKGSINIVLAGEEFNVDLEPAVWVNKDIKAYYDDEDGNVKEMKMDPIYQYTGHVVGYPESTVCFTLDDKVVLGWIEINDEMYIIEQVGWIIDKNSKKVTYIIYKNSDTEYTGPAPDGNDIDMSDAEASLYITTNTDDLNADENINTRATNVYVLCAYDTEFNNKYSSPGTEIYNMFSQTKTAFSESYIGVNLVLDCYYYMSTLTNTESSALLNEFKAEVATKRNTENSDLATLYTGKDLDGSIIGLAKQYTGSSDQAYSIAQMRSGGISTYQATFYQRCTLSAHEMGHNFGAVHTQATTWGVGLLTYTTVMYDTFLGCTRMEFSTTDPSGHGDTSHNNAGVIASHKSTVSGFQ